MATDQIIDDLNISDGSNFASCTFFGFKVGSSAVGPNQSNFIRQNLRDLLTKLKPGETAAIQVSGLCSFTGSKAANLALGMQRANAVIAIATQAGLTRLPQTVWEAPRSKGFEDAERIEKKPPRDPAIREAHSDIFRAVEVDIRIFTGPKPPQPPRPPKQHHFGIRAIYTASIPVTPFILSPTFDRMMFEISEVESQTKALYEYTSIGITVGTPLGLLEKAAKLGRLTKVVLTAAGFVNVAFAGPVNPFTHRRGPNVFKPVTEWGGAATYFSLGGLTVTLSSFIAFGGFDVVPPLRHNARVDPFDSGSSIGFPSFNTGEGRFNLVSGSVS
jgi:hypothetical protein